MAVSQQSTDSFLNTYFFKLIVNCPHIFLSHYHTELLIVLVIILLVKCLNVHPNLMLSHVVFPLSATIYYEESAFGRCLAMLPTLFMKYIRNQPTSP